MFLVRRGEHDLEDIEHLVITYPNEIRNFASKLDPEAGIPIIAYRPSWGQIFGC